MGAVQDGARPFATFGNPSCPTSHLASLQLSLAALVAFGVLNRVLYKMALVPLGDYVFFLAQFQTFGYCLVYFAALGVRYR